MSLSLPSILFSSMHYDCAMKMCCVFFHSEMRESVHRFATVSLIFFSHISYLIQYGTSFEEFLAFSGFFCLAVTVVFSGS